MEHKHPPEWVWEEYLGKGAYGVVSLWKHQQSGARMAIKTFKDSKYEGWHQREKELMAQLNHRNLVKTFPIPAQFLGHASRIICMEYCSGGNLRKILNTPENCCGVAEQVIRKCLKDVKDGLEYLHVSQKISHRDLKPENIVLQKTPDEEIFKLIDLGFGKQCEPSQLLTTLVGTSGYVAPEVFSEGYSSCVDYWSLGIICHEMVTGYRPFLPHMNPPKWIEKVRFKSDDVISVYENVYGKDDDLVFSEHLSSENRVTKAFAQKLEPWLRLALRWDYRKRGKDRQNQLIIFSLLDNILTQKVFTIFCAVSYTFLSYEIDESTTALKIKHLISRDTQQSAEDQILLLPSGETLNDDLKLSEHWDPTLVAMLYVFAKEGIRLPLEPAAPSVTVTSLLEEYKEPLPYYKRKKACSSAVHFLQTQLSLCEAFYEALAAVMLSILNEMKRLSNLEYSVRDEIVICTAKLEVLKDSIFYNEKRYIREQKEGTIRGTGDFLRDAKGKLRSFRSAAEVLMEEQLRDNSALFEIQTKLTEASTFESTEHTILELKKCLEKGHRIIRNMQVMPKELRDSEENCSEMVELVLSFLEIMDRYINDQTIRDTVERFQECKRMIDELVESFGNRSIDVRNVNSDIMAAERGLFKTVWDLHLSIIERPTINMPPSVNDMNDESIRLHRQFEESFSRHKEEFADIQKRLEQLNSEPTS